MSSPAKMTRFASDAGGPSKLISWPIAKPSAKLSSRYVHNRCLVRPWPCRPLQSSAPSRPGTGLSQAWVTGPAAGPGLLVRPAHVGSQHFLNPCRTWQPNSSALDCKGKQPLDNPSSGRGGRALQCRPCRHTLQLLHFSLCSCSSCLAPGQWMQVRAVQTQAPPTIIPSSMDTRGFF